MMQTPTTIGFRSLSRSWSIVALAAIAGTASPALGDDPVVAGAGGITEIEEAILGPGRNPATPDKKPGDAAAGKEESSPFHLGFSVDWSTHYLSRGIVTETGGFILQPAATFSYDIISNDDITLSANFGTWHSFHDKKTLSKVGDGFRGSWYEADYTGGLSAVLGDFTVGLTYGWYNYPNNGATQTEEVIVAATYDDSALLGAFSLKPTALVFIETADGFTDGIGRGVGLQVGITPGIDLPISENFKPRLDLPINAGFSLHDYYQDVATGDDDVFGYFSVGPKLAIPLPFGEGAGDWKLNMAATFWFLGDNASKTNNDDKTEVQFTVGVSVSF